MTSSGAQRSNSATRRVLPMPASPVTRTVTGDPSAAARSAASRRACSRVRPINVRLVAAPHHGRILPSRGRLCAGTRRAPPTGRRSIPPVGGARSGRLVQHGPVRPHGHSVPDDARVGVSLPPLSPAGPHADRQDDHERRARRRAPRPRRRSASPWTCWWWGSRSRSWVPLLLERLPRTAERVPWSASATVCTSGAAPHVLARPP